MRPKRTLSGGRGPAGERMEALTPNRGRGWVTRLGWRRWAGSVRDLNAFVDAVIEGADALLDSVRTRVLPEDGDHGIKELLKSLLVLLLYEHLQLHLTRQLHECCCLAARGKSTGRGRGRWRDEGINKSFEQGRGSGEDGRGQVGDGNLGRWG